MSSLGAAPGSPGAGGAEPASPEAAAVRGTSCIKARLVHEEPKMVHFSDFLSPEEAAHLIALAEGRWARSTVTRGSASALLQGSAAAAAAASSSSSAPAADAAAAAEGAAAAEAAIAAEAAAAEAAAAEAAAAAAASEAAEGAAAAAEGTAAASGGDAEGGAAAAAEGAAAAESGEGPKEVKSEGCTSTMVRLDYSESPVVERILARVSTVTGHPLENLERLVLVRYGPGQRFRVHHDGAMRPMTVFAYLNDVAVGGETRFPKLGLQIRPAMGTAVMWSNTIGSGPEAESDRRMDHEAVAPGEGCEKIGMNCFVNCRKQRDCSHIRIVRAQGGA